MPRTKVVIKKIKATQESDDREANLKFVLQYMQHQKRKMLAKLEDEKNKMLDAHRQFSKEVKLQIPYKYLNMTIREIMDSESVESTRSIQGISTVDLLNATKTFKRERKTVKRSASVADDEGYLTAESVTSGGRKSRSKIKVLHSSRTTRSLSRNTQRVTSTYKTPANKNILPNTYGIVTPKCKPNTPQVLLRRPKNGEVAFSTQGSPLYTASVVSETIANINIPLLDGRLFTLQPQGGLRISQIPEFDPETRRQLEKLRENLNKVCAASEMSK